MALTPNPADLGNLQAIKSNLLAVLATETAWQVLNGPKPSYTLDGENYQWTEWRAQMLDKIATLNQLIQLEAGPYMLVSKMTG